MFNEFKKLNIVKKKLSKDLLNLIEEYYKKNMIIYDYCNKCRIFNIYSDNDYVKDIGYVCLICRLYEFPL